MDLLILSPGEQGGTGFIPQCLEGGKNVAGMLDREPNKAEECLTRVCIHRSWHCPWQFLEGLKEKLDNLIQIQPYK